MYIEQMLFVPKPTSAEKRVLLFLSFILRAWCILYVYSRLLITPPCISIYNTSEKVRLLYTASSCTSMVAELIFFAFIYIYEMHLAGFGMTSNRTWSDLYMRALFFFAAIQ